VCGTGRFRIERDGVNVAAEVAWWEIQSNDHVFEKGFADPSGFILDGQGVDGFFERLPPQNKGDFCLTDETSVDLSVRCLIPSRGDGGTWDRGKIWIGAHPEGIVGKDPLVNVLMAKPDTQRVETIPGKAMFRWEQEDVEVELLWVDCKFEGDRFTETSV